MTIILYFSFFAFQQLHLTSHLAVSPISLTPSTKTLQHHFALHLPHTLHFTHTQMVLPTGCRNSPTKHRINRLHWPLTM